MAEIVALRSGDAVEPGEPNTELVAFLRRFLNEAERGEIEGIAIAVARPNQTTTTDFFITNNAGFATVAASAMLAHEVIEHMRSRSKRTDG